MNKILITILLFTLSYAHAEEKVISLDEVASKVKETNFTILENAQRIYQAKETITFNKK